jgi:lia operon protein LiaF
LLNRPKSEYVSWIIIIGFMLLGLEVLFFNKGLIFSLLIAAGMVYFGRKELSNLFGKLLFWIGIIVFAISVFGMITFRFFVLAVIIYFLLQYFQTKKKPETVIPMFTEPAPKESANGENYISKQPLLKNALFGEQKTVEHTYEWNDVNIQTGVGDTVIDLSYTVLPKGETVIFIRKIVGNIEVLIPYDIEVSVHHSVVIGAVNILDYQSTKLFNQNIHVQTPDYDHTEQRIHIFTSLLVGNLEVRRV